MADPRLAMRLCARVGSFRSELAGNFSRERLMPSTCRPFANRSPVFRERFMPLVELAGQYWWLGPAGGALLGLLVGSFHQCGCVAIADHDGNRVASGKPRRRKRKPESLKYRTAIDPERFSLWRPGSACPHCNTPIRSHQNIPVFSFVFMRGRCGACAQRISRRYPIVEAIVGIFSAIVAWKFGYSWQCLAALFLTWTLIAAAIIDIDHYLLPDSITLPLLWAGLLLAAVPGNLFFADLHSGVIGAAAGYGSLWSVATVFRLVTGREGMGYGDFKLLGALGAWLGWQMLPLIITLSAAVGSVVGIAAITVLRRSRAQPIPFGPYLAMAGWIAALWGEELMALYLDLIL